eukprot:CAMPEP_0172692030 /NCGR_PEP_ID=MMETSP1074-20121228/24956_1 /TAXON_ID=2916 /ORGANISM="Ceratium fusus, Strain PA161109" /LENGTH=87 /DNA_ID=CAMNT_0013512157 /DNA_START=161 /DNA_END=425 /DNA_ORIENTATION=-
MPNLHAGNNISRKDERMFQQLGLIANGGANINRVPERATTIEPTPMRLNSMFPLALLWATSEHLSMQEPSPMETRPGSVIIRSVPVG